VNSNNNNDNILLTGLSPFRSVVEVKTVSNINSKFLIILIIPQLLYYITNHLRSSKQIGDDYNNDYNSTFPLSHKINVV